MALTVTLTGSRCLALTDQKTKLEQLFLWKLADELKLSIKEEKALDEILHDIQKRRQDTSDALVAKLADLAKQKNVKEIETSIVSYRALLKSQYQINIDEIDKIKKALGSEKVAQYLVVKSNLSNQVKNLLLKPAQEQNEN